MFEENLFDPDNQEKIKDSLINDLEQMDKAEQRHTFTVTLVFSSRIIKINLGMN